MSKALSATWCLTGYIVNICQGDILGMVHTGFRDSGLVLGHRAAGLQGLTISRITTQGVYAPGGYQGTEPEGI